MTSHKGAHTAAAPPPDQAPNTPAEWIALATLLRPQGRRGELLADLGTDLRELFADGLEVFLSKSNTPAPGTAPVKLEAHWFPTGRNAGRIVLKFVGTESINDAQKLEKLQVLIPVASLPELEADTYFVKDLVGCTLFDGEEAIGEVVDVEFATGPDGRTRLTDAAPLLVVELPAEENAAADDEADQVLIPLIRAWITNADLVNKRLHMTLPDGLFDEPDQEGFEEEDSSEDE